jgi:hypothetical protein
VTPVGKNGAPWVRDVALPALAERLERAGLAGEAFLVRSLDRHLRRNRFVKVPPLRGACRASRSMTPELAVRIRTMKAENPDMTSQQIADALGVNSGRVSEALHGLR